MNLGFVENSTPERELFVVERFSAVVVPLRNIRKSALKRSTTNPTCGRFRIPMRAKKEWRLPMNLPRPLTCVLSPAAGARKFQCACPRGALSSPHRGRSWVRGIRFLSSVRDKFVVESLPQGEGERPRGHIISDFLSTVFWGEDKGEGDFVTAFSQAVMSETLLSL
jgi:hypothetical protein